jgi:HK97 family phage major capsid protein
MSRELLEKRAGLIAEARGVIDAAEAEDRGLSDEENARYDALMESVNDLTERVERAQRQQQLEAELRQPLTVATRPEPGDGGQAARLEFVSRAMHSVNKDHSDWLDQPEWRKLLNFAQDKYARAFRSWMRNGVASNEVRALQADSETVGGYLVTPMQFVDRLIQAVDNMVYVRQWATVFPVPTADSLGAPSLDTDPADPAWTSELLIGSEDSSMAFGRRELSPHPLAKYIKISRKLLRMVPDVEGLVRERLGYKFAVVMENAYLNGTGAQQPLGVFVASNDGISTGRDASTGNTDTEIRFDGLIEAKYTLKPQYWPRARWMFHRDGVKMIAKLKDGNGQYLWRESVRVGEPDRVLGFPVFMSEYAPNTFTTGLYVGILGDFAHYWIADALNMEMQRLVELYAATNQVGFIGRMESDGMPVLEEAFVRVKLA